MKSQVAITVSGHVFAYPTVTPINAGGSLPPLASRMAAQDAPRVSAEAQRNPLWPIEFATTL